MYNKNTNIQYVTCRGPPSCWKPLWQQKTRLLTAILLPHHILENKSKVLARRFSQPPSPQIAMLGIWRYSLDVVAPTFGAWFPNERSENKLCIRGLRGGARACSWELYLSVAIIIPCTVGHPLRRYRSRWIFDPKIGVSDLVERCQTETYVVGPAFQTCAMHGAYPISLRTRSGFPCDNPIRKLQDKSETTWFVCLICACFPTHLATSTDFCLFPCTSYDVLRFFQRKKKGFLFL